MMKHSLVLDVGLLLVLAFSYLLINCASSWRSLTSTVGAGGGLLILLLLMMPSEVDAVVVAAAAELLVVVAAGGRNFGISSSFPLIVPESCWMMNN